MMVGRAAVESKKSRAIAALLSHRTLHEAAEAAHVSERTLRRWMCDKAFSDALQHERQAILENITELLTKQSVAAIATLAKIMGASKAPAASRVSAARAVLDFTFRNADHGALERRIEQLELVMSREKE